MQCYNDSKYRLLGYCRAIDKYILTDRLHEDNEICVKEAVLLKDNTVTTRLFRGNPDNLVEEIGIEVFRRN